MRRKTSKHKGWKDHYSALAKKENFPARSVYKLKEIHRKYNLIKKGDRVLDLGCSPGSWLIYASELTGKKGQVIGVDLKPLSVKVPLNAIIYTANILSVDDEFYESIGENFNVILSDMAPATTGNKNVDAARSFNLCEAALSIAQKSLMHGGSFVCKIFQGEDFNRFSDLVKASFKKSRIFKPQSSRKASKEIYIIGLNKN